MSETHAVVALFSFLKRFYNRQPGAAAEVVPPGECGKPGRTKALQDLINNLGKLS